MHQKIEQLRHNLRRLPRNTFDYFDPRTLEGRRHLATGSLIAIGLIGFGAFSACAPTPQDYAAATATVASVHATQTFDGAIQALRQTAAPQFAQATATVVAAEAVSTQKVVESAGNTLRIAIYLIGGSVSAGTLLAAIGWGIRMLNRPDVVTTRLGAPVFTLPARTSLALTDGKIRLNRGDTTYIFPAASSNQVGIQAKVTPDGQTTLITYGSEELAFKTAQLNVVIAWILEAGRRNNRSPEEVFSQFKNYGIVTGQLSPEVTEADNIVDEEYLQ